MATSVKPIPEGYSAVTPYLMVRDCAAALDFYKTAFGATEQVRMNMPDGRIGHAEIMIGDSRIMLADEFPEMNAKGPQAYGGSPVSLMLYVENVDTVFARAISAGAQSSRPVKNQFYGDRTGTLTDPFGHIWNVGTHVEDVSADEMRRRMAAHTAQSEASP